MKCPYCAEEIAPGARKCKHCGEWIDKIERMREAGHKNIQTGASQTGGTCGCLILMAVAATIYVLMGGMK